MPPRSDPLFPTDRQPKVFPPTTGRNVMIPNNGVNGAVIQALRGRGGRA